MFAFAYKASSDLVLTLLDSSGTGSGQCCVGGKHACVVPMCYEVVCPEERGLVIRGPLDAAALGAENRLNQLLAVHGHEKNRLRRIFEIGHSSRFC